MPWREAREPGDSAVLDTYWAERRFDRSATVLFTDTVIRLFSNNTPLLDRLGGAGLMLLGGIAAARKVLARCMMFGAND